MRASRSSSSTSATRTSTATGSIEGAANISRGFLEFRVGTAAPEPTTPIVLYARRACAPCFAAKALHDLGYTNVVNLQGGFQRWAQSGLGVVKDSPLGSEQIQRYSRHFLLPQVGRKGSASSCAPRCC